MLINLLRNVRNNVLNTFHLSSCIYVKQFLLSFPYCDKSVSQQPTKNQANYSSWIITRVFPIFPPLDAHKSTAYQHPLTRSASIMSPTRGDKKKKRCGTRNRVPWPRFHNLGSFDNSGASRFAFSLKVKTRWKWRGARDPRLGSDRSWFLWLGRGVSESTGLRSRKKIQSSSAFFFLFLFFFRSGRTLSPRILTIQLVSLLLDGKRELIGDCCHRPWDFALMILTRGLLGPPRWSFSKRERDRERNLLDFYRNFILSC